ncbi:SH3 domain-containing protein [uncultured Chitinophaga sp.]|jgi:SH3 domain protein|uniref:SH3 domain-containing protein n=1 Tax=uncultured Chitinophaga sp. TaxID=339340 RepID=UPI00260C776C|nr:SH3 domain-containing protein [uncultured Chitinophaga sp.]
MSTGKKTGTGEWVLIIIGATIGLYVLGQLILLLVIVAAFYGYNFFFLVDNMLRIDALNPVLVWGMLGLFIGSITGVTVAVKKKKLQKWLILCPLLLAALVITIMCMINKPAQYTSDFNLSGIARPAVAVEITREFYIATTDVNIRSTASKFGRVISTLKRGQEAEVLQKGFYDSRNAEWVKIRYNGREGFVNLHYLKKNRTETGPSQPTR